MRARPLTSNRLIAAGAFLWLAAADEVAAQAPPAPTLIYPTATITESNPTYQWNAVSTATQYFVQVGDGVSILRQGLYTTAQVCSGSTCAINLALNLPVGSYWWGVQAKNAAGGTWSTLNFTVQAPPAPALVYPTGSVIDPNPTYRWNTSSGATEYFVQVGDGIAILAQGLYATAQVCVGSACSINLAHNLPVGQYWWGVQAKNASGGTWSTLNFGVLAPPPATLGSPSGAIAVTNPVYTWTAATGATGYYIQVADLTPAVVAQGSYTTSVCAGSNCSFQLPQSLGQGSYNWWVLSSNASGGSWSAANAFSVQAPPAPALTAPTGNVATATPTYRWNTSTGATNYRLQVSNGVTPTQYGPFTPAQVCTGSTCAFTSPTSLPAGPYTWTAQAQNAVGWGPWATEMSFTVVAGTVPPNLLTPNGPMTVSSPTYTWTVSAGATEYFLQVDDASGAHNFQGTFSAAGICGPSTCSATPSVTLAAGDHTWRVQAKNGPGGPWSADKTFTVGGCSGQFSIGDFNGDGMTDRLCSGAGGTFVSLSTHTGFQATTPWLTQSIAKPLMGDFNSDGYTDVAELNTSTAIVSVALSNGSGFGALTPWGTAQAGQTSCASPSAEARTGDFNGDGRTDVSCHRNSYDGVFVGLSTGAGFTFGVFGNALCDATERIGVLDMNGDGKDDWYCLGIANNLLLVFRSTGTAFVPQIQAVTAADSSFCDDADIILGDFNGDGKTDVSCRGNGRVRLSTGSSYVDGAGNSGAWCTPHPGATWPFAFGADVDGDGTAEMVCAGTGSAGAGIHVRKLVGTTLGPTEVWLGGFCFGDIRPGDFNGDGKPDILCDDTGAWASSGTRDVRVDLMSKSTSSLGGAFDVWYFPSTYYPNEPGFAPRPVASITYQDGRGPSRFEAGYWYEGGKVDRQERRSLGFRFVRTTLPRLDGLLEQPYPYVETTFSQTLPSAGQPLEVKRFASDGFLMSKQTYAYTETTTLPRKSLLNRSDSYTYGIGGPVHTYSTFPVYDAYGNLRQSVSWGDASISEDDLQTDFTLVPNVSLYIVNKVAKVERRMPGQAPAQIEEYEYDHTGLTYAQEAVWNAAPTKGNLTAVSRWLDRASKTVNRRMTYGSKGDVLAVRDETNRPVTTTYLPAPHDFLPATVKNGPNETTTLVWDYRCQAITSDTDPNNQATTQTYDSLCRASRTTYPTDPVNSYVQRTYLNIGSPTTQKTRTETPGPGNSGADWSEDYFDALGRTYKSVKRGPATGQEIVTERTYNARSGVATSTEPYYANAAPQSHRVTSYDYDDADRLIKTTLPDDNEVTTEYLANGQTTTDPNGKWVTTRVTGLTKEVERLWNGSPSITTTTYDAFGRQIALHDAKSNAWSYQYDSLNRLRDETDPDAGHWQYDYDDAGRPLTQTDAKPQVTTMTYEGAGRIATKVSPVGTVTYTYGEPRTGYFNKGRLTTITSPTDTLTLDYDKLGRSAKQQRVFNGTTYTVSKAWDAGGYLLGTTYPDGETVGDTTPSPTNPLGYDEAGRLKTIPGYITSQEYDAAGRPTDRQNANGTHTQWTYAPQSGLLENIYTESSNHSPRQDLVYTYDNAGLVTSVTSPFSDEGWDYEYDGFYHLTKATSHSSATNTQTWNYDEIDRITYNSRSGLGTYDYPLPGSPRPHAPLTINAGPTRLYDPNGHLTSASVSGVSQTLTWDGENRLLQAVVGGTTTTFTYDSFGERLKKTSGSTTSIYPFGDDYEIVGGTITKYISVEGLGVVAKTRGTNKYWIHTDPLGSINVITDSGGTATTVRRRFRPYGETLTTTGSHTEFRGWIDQRNDTETSLTYLHARYFDPKLGQFLSPDPIGAAGGLNQYAYGFGDPTNGTDRSGLGPECPSPPTHEGKGPISRDPIGVCVVKDVEPPNPNAPSVGGGAFLTGLFFLLFGDGDSQHPGSGPSAGVPRGQQPPTTPVPPPPITIPVPPLRPGSSGSPASGASPGSGTSWVDHTLYYSAQFCAGFGDCLGFGLTRSVRQQLGVDDVIDFDSTAYAYGVYTEIGLEVSLTGASYGLRSAAKGISQSAARAGARHGVRGASVWHHTNALKQGLFPTAPLPRAIRHARLNGRLLSPAEHQAAHAALRRHEGYLLAMFNPALTALRIHNVGVWIDSSE